MFKKALFISVLAMFLFAGMVQGQANDLPSPGILPDNPFYFLKSFFEDIGTFLTFGEQARAERFLRLAETRLAEASGLAEKGRLELAEEAVNRYQEQLNRALARTEQLRARGLDADGFLARVSEATLRHQSALIGVYEKVPEEARPAIERAMENSMRGHEEALQAISGEKREEVMQQMEQKRSDVEQRAREARERGVSIPMIPVDVPLVPEDIPGVPEPLMNDTIPELPADVPGVPGPPVNDTAPGPPVTPGR